MVERKGQRQVPKIRHCVPAVSASTVFATLILPPDPCRLGALSGECGPHQGQGDIQLFHTSPKQAL